MAKIRHISIVNFRGIKRLEWCPNPGLNCIIGPGDVGKSTIIDAIDLALGPRRTKLFSDADFHMLDCENPIEILITIGCLAEQLQNFEKYDMFLRGYDATLGLIVDEPGGSLENVLTMRLSVAKDLDPIWGLYSERAEADGREKNITWGDRLLLAGTRIGSSSEHHLTWRKGAVLNRIGEETPKSSSAIAEAKRAAMQAFGQESQPDLAETLSAVSKTASDLGVNLNGELQALLNAHSISLSGGTIAVHDGNGLPLSSLGLGSSRLLVAGLLDKAKMGSNIILVDEIENGLEPHRIIRLLGAIGAKDPDEGKQSFITSHSPTALMELAAGQLFRLSSDQVGSRLRKASVDDNSQGALRSAPESFLARSVVICEGASEIGFVRGLDQVFSIQNISIFANGVSLLNAGGVSKLYKYAPTLLSLGLRAASFRDDDTEPDLASEQIFIENSGTLFKWKPGQKLEAAIIHGLPDSACLQLLEFGVELMGEDTVRAHIQSVSQNQSSLDALRATALAQSLSFQERNWLVDACTTRNAWFKTIDRMERLAGTVVAPSYANLLPDLKAVIDGLFQWAYQN